MLVLTRHLEQEIVIGENVVVTVLGIRGNQVRLGIKAPTEVSIHRREVYESIQQGGDPPCHPTSSCAEEIPTPSCPGERGML